MTRDEFHAALRVLLNLDLDELVQAGVFREPTSPIEKTVEQRWQQFNANPFLYFIRCDDTHCRRLWALMQAHCKHQFAMPREDNTMKCAICGRPFGDSIHVIV